MHIFFKLTLRKFSAKPAESTFEDVLRYNNDIQELRVCADVIRFCL